MPDRPLTPGDDQTPDRDAELRALLAERSRVPPAHVERWVGVHERVRVMRRRRVATRSALSAGLVLALAVAVPTIVRAAAEGRQQLAAAPAASAPAAREPQPPLPLQPPTPLRLPQRWVDSPTQPPGAAGGPTRVSGAPLYRPAKIFPFDQLAAPAEPRFGGAGSVIAAKSARDVGAVGTFDVQVTMPLRMSLAVQSTGAGRVRVSLDDRPVADFRFWGGAAAGYDTLSPFDADLQDAGVTVGRPVTVTITASGFRRPAWRVVLLDGIKR